MNTPTKITLALIGSEVALAAAMTVGAAHTTGIAYADPAPDSDYTVVTRDGNVYTDAVLAENLHRPDLLPTCAQEDCSDQPHQVGMWLDDDTGNWYLSLGERSLLVIDDTE